MGYFPHIVLVFGLLVYYINAQDFPPKQAKKYSLGEPTTLFTKGDRSYREAWYTVEDRTQFVFRVKACSEAYLALTSYPEISSDFSLEIALGVQDNTRSQIKDFYQNEGLFDTATKGILHCNEFRTFWIRWASAYIQVGKGPIVGEQTFMNTDDVKVHAINAIGLASGQGNGAVWEVKENSADQLLLFTQDEYKYGSMWKSIINRNFFTFSAMAAGHVHLVLTEGLGQTSANVAEFVIGGWDLNRTVIRSNIFGNWQGGAIQADTYTNGILSDKEYRDFWIGWMNGTIELGYGTVYGQSRIIKWEGSRLKPRYLGATTGFGAAGQWIFQDDQESMNYIFTKKQESDDPMDWYKNVWLESPRKEFVTFQVKACQRACLLLSDSRDINPEQSIEIIIGDSDNTKTVFRFLQMMPPGNIAETDTFDILSCNQTRHFWLSWKDNTIRLGNWHIYDYNVILEKEIGEGYPIRAISLATPTANSVWMIRDSFGERMELTTPDIFNNFDQLWRTVTLRDYFMFQVQACSDVHVCLSPTPGVEPEEVYYDIVISGWDNTQTQIRKVLNGERTDASEPVDTTGLLDCDQLRDIWVSWTDNVIQLGRGALPKHHVLLTQPLTQLYPVKAVSVSTGFGYSGKWYWDNDNGDFMMYYTNVAINENSLALSKDIIWVSFKLRACYEANIFLSSTEGGSVYEIALGLENNQKSAIKVGGNPVVQADTPDLLSCLDERYIWVTWENSQLRVGQSSLVGLNPLLQWTNNQNFNNLDMMHFYSRAVDLNCRWKIFYNAGLWTSFKTPVDFGYHYIWESVEHRQGFVFNVRTCSDVHVILSDLVRVIDRKYEVVIGGWSNSRSVIRMFQVREYIEAKTPDINSCTEGRSFWITWQNGAIEVGRGEVIGQDRFLDFHPLEFYQVKFVGFSTGFSFNGTWSIKLLDELLATAPPATEDPDTEGPGGSGSSLSGGAIAGIVIGVLVLIGLVGVIVFMAVCREEPSPLASLISRGQGDATPIAPENIAPEQPDQDTENIEKGDPSQA